MHVNKGFTLIELIIVLALISVLASIAMPGMTSRAIKNNIKQTIPMFEDYKQTIATYYLFTGKFPKNNADAGLPAPDTIVGNYFNSIIIKDGAIHIFFGNKIQKQIDGGVLSLRPIYVPMEPMVPISWICGLDEDIPKGMIASGKNFTDIPPEYLPVMCR